MRFSTIFAPIALAVSAMAQGLTVSTPPSLVQCQPVALSWSGGTAPYILAVIPGGQPSAAAIAFIANNVQGNSYTWTVNIQVGTNVNIKVTDATGTSQYSSQLSVQQGASSSCLSASSGSSSMSGASSSGSVAAVSSSSMMASSTSASATSSAMSSSTAASSSATASAASASASSVSGQVSSALASITSTSRSGAFATAVAGLPAVAAGALGAVAVLF